MANLATSVPSTPREKLERYLHVIREPGAYLTALYLLTAFPLALFYFLVLIAGALAGAVFAVVAVGVLLLLAMLVVAWGFALFERELAIGLLGLDVPPLALPDLEIRTPWERLSRHLRQATTWKSLAYLLVKLPFGIFASLLAGALLGPSLAMLLGPVFFLLGHGPVPEAIGALIFPGLIGVAALATSLHVLNIVGRAWGTVCDRHARGGG
ncbi:MAG: sensor domain-containing protein [Candidatus Dormibacteraceae bacterium]